MRQSRAWIQGLIVRLWIGCVPEPPAAEPSGAPEVTIAPRAESGAQPVLRLSVLEAGVPIEPESLGLFVGELSDYHLGRIARRDLPGTLLERRVPISRFRDRGRPAVVVAPEIPLNPGESYTLVTPRWGRLAEFRIATAEALPFLERVWPPRGQAGGGRALFCGSAAPATASAFELEPAGRVAEMTPVADSEPGRSCVAVRFDANGLEGSVAVFPAELEGVALDPAPLMLVPPEPVASRGCGSEEVVLGPGCARVEDDRLIVTGPEAPLLWLFTSEQLAAAVPASSGAPFVARGLTPDSRAHIAGVAITLGGNETRFEIDVRTSAARERVVINEVLANPLGAEAAGEWIELVNDGALSTELSGFELEDSAGVVALPPAMIAPGEHVLLVRTGFSFGGSDVAAPPGTRLIALGELGKQGLSNAGEALFLWAPDGTLASAFPALAARRAGVSVARRRPHAFDHELSAFGEHAGPGASPGAPNQLADPLR